MPSWMRTSRTKADAKAAYAAALARARAANAAIDPYAVTVGTSVQ